MHENAGAGTVVGQVTYDKGGADLNTVVLSGAGSENFSIDLNGTIRVSSSASLDYETHLLYQPVVTINNSYGTSSKKIFIFIIDSYDVPSFMSFIGGNVKENSDVGTVVGKLNFDSGSMPIEDVYFIGDASKNFNILNNGTIVVARDLLNYEEKNHYILKVAAKNRLGSSQVVTVHLFVDDISERLVILEDFVVNDVLESVSVGTIVGTINVLDEGSSPIIEYVISGNYANCFSVDLQGVVRTVRL